MFNANKSIYMKKQMNRMKCGLPYKPVINTTINETLNVYPGVTIDDIPYGTLNTMVIGNGTIGDLVLNSRLDLKSSVHNILDVNLYKYMPFYLKLESEAGLYPPSDKLRLRTIVTINNETYVAYYGYDIDNFEYNDDIISYSNITDDYVNISKVDMSDTAIINPTVSNSSSVDTTQAEYISDFIKLYAILSQDELDDIISAQEILNPGIKPIITELGLCMSKVSDINGHDESYETQIGYFIDVYEPITNIENPYVDFFIELGDMEVMNR